MVRGATEPRGGLSMQNLLRNAFYALRVSRKTYFVRDCRPFLECIPWELR